MNYLKDFGIDGKPCSRQEIEEIRNMVHPKSLPECYLEFLSVAGKGSSAFIGQSCFYDDLFDMKEGLEILLKQDGSELALQPEDFVFFSSQGCLYAFFKLDTVDDPQVFGYVEGSGQREFITVAKTLSDFFYRASRHDPTLFSL